MTLAEFDSARDTHACAQCGLTGMQTELNPNNNGLLVRCPHCGSNRPWGSLLYLKQNERKRPRRPALPDGETLDSIWQKFGDCCTVCGAPKDALKVLGIGRQVHHVQPYALEGHKGPLVPICTLCHPVVNERQRLYWFIQRVVMKQEHDEEPVASERGQTFGALYHAERGA
jgi:hypothetical protein